MRSTTTVKAAGFERSSGRQIFAQSQSVLVATPKPACVVSDKPGGAARYCSPGQQVGFLATSCTCPPLYQAVEQEEEARSRGWHFRKRDEPACLGCGSPHAPVDAKIVSLREAATHVCACPGRSFVLGTSGAIYSARWLGTAASCTPSASPWTRWAPAAGGSTLGC